MYPIQRLIHHIAMEQNREEQGQFHDLFHGTSMLDDYATGYRIPGFRRSRSGTDRSF